MESKSDFKIYWESQGKNQMCGLHCINSLLQGPFFEPDMLKDIAVHLDEEEAKLMGIDPKKKHYKSVNYDRDGNYNIQVITEALKIYGVEIQPKKKEDLDKILNSSPSDIDLQGFILNSTSHWIALRKINGLWFNLNSTNPSPGPQIVSDFYLSAFIDETYNYGFTHFQVIGLNPVDESNFSSINSKNQKVVKYSDILKVKPSKLNFGDTDDMEMEKAMKESINLNSKQSVPTIQNQEIHYDDNEIDDDIKHILELSLAEYKKTVSQDPDSNTKELEVENIEVTIIHGEDVWEPVKFKKTANAGDIQAYCQKKLNEVSSLKIHIDSITTETLDVNKCIGEISDKFGTLTLYIE